MTLPTSIKLDSMRSLVNHFPQLLTTMQIEQSILDRLNDVSKEGVKGICFLGMGGSSIAGSYVRALLVDEAPIPISIVRDYSLPAYIDNKWVVIAVSYSGNTEETISSLTKAKQIDAKIIILTSGGKMAQEIEQPIILLPKGIQPRATLPLMFTVALQIAETVANLKISTFRSLEKILVEKSSTWNEWLQHPRELAESFSKKIPLFIGARHLTPVAYRAKCQINENSKALAFHSELPESNHNEIESFVTTYGCSILPIFLRSGFESSEIKKRFDVTNELYHEMGLNPANLRVTGDTRLEEMLVLTHFLDMVSVDFAELRDVDPVSVEKIQELKHRLSDD